jgi:thiamine-monophosphate kinase
MTRPDPDAESNALLQGEAAIIQDYLAPLAAGYPGALGLRDDCATVAPAPGHELVVKVDPVAAGIHFLPDDPPADIAWKALAVNVSDLAAKGAVPRVYLMALSFPDAPTRDWMAAFARGLAEAQAAFGMHLVGGDTDRRPGPVTISITVLGEVPVGRMVLRGAGRAGDVLFVTGALGQSALGLALLQDPALGRRWGLDDRAVADAVLKYRRPQPRLALRAALRAHASAAMDLSDGLAKDLGRMCAASGTGATVWVDRVPHDAVARAAIADDGRHWNDVLAAGDDYEILCAVPPAAAGAFEAAAIAAGQSAAAPFAVTRIGELTDTGQVQFRDRDGHPVTLGRTGWDHF